MKTLLTHNALRKSLKSPKSRNIYVRFSSRKSLHNLLKQLRKSKTRFTTEDTSGSFKIRVEGSVGTPQRIYEYNSPGDFRAMGIYMKLKKEIFGRPLKNLSEISPSDLKYWSINSNAFNKPIRQVTNIDIKKAYPYAFFNLGFIGKEILGYLLDLDTSGHKLSRLKGMGILAKRKLVNAYSSGKFRGYEIQENEYLRRCFFNACKEIDDIMISLCEISGRDLLFMWVDGIYVDTSTKRGKMCVKRICNAIRKRGYKYSKEILKDFRYHECRHSDTSYTSYTSDKRVLNISFRKRKSGKKRNAWAKKPKTFTLPLDKGFTERID